MSFIFKVFTLPESLNLFLGWKVQYLINYRYIYCKYIVYFIISFCGFSCFHFSCYLRSESDSSGEKREGEGVVPIPCIPGSRSRLKKESLCSNGELEEDFVMVDPSQFRKATVPNYSEDQQNGSAHVGGLRAGKGLFPSSQSINWAYRKQIKIK